MSIVRHVKLGGHALRVRCPVDNLVESSAASIIPSFIFFFKLDHDIFSAAVLHPATVLPVLMLTSRLSRGAPTFNWAIAAARHRFVHA